MFLTFVLLSCEKGERYRGTFKLENKLTTPWLKMKKTNRQTIVHKTQHRKLKTEQQEPHQKLGVISGAPEGWAYPAPYVTSVVLLMLVRTR